MATITRLYNSVDQVRDVVAKLKSSGIKESDISMVGSNADKIIDSDDDGVDDRAEGAAKGAGVGAAVGGAAGLLAGLGLLAIPGIGPVVAAGYLASTALGVAAGGAAGGLIGALTQSGVSEDDAEVYAESVRRGGYILSVKAPDSQQSSVEAIMANGVDVRRRAEEYRASGWKKFDTAGTGMSADEIERERQMYRQQ